MGKNLAAPRSCTSAKQLCRRIYRHTGGINAVVAPKRRAFTEACAAVQNGCMKSREVFTSLSQVYLCPFCVIRVYRRDKQTGALSRRVLSRPKAPYRLCLATGGFALGSRSPCECLSGQHSPSRYRLFGVSVRRVTHLYRCVIRLIPQTRVTAGSDPSCGVPASTRETLPNRCSSPALFGNSARLSELPEYLRLDRRHFAPSASCSFGNIKETRRIQSP